MKKILMISALFFPAGSLWSAKVDDNDMKKCMDKIEKLCKTDVAKCIEKNRSQISRVCKKTFEWAEKKGVEDMTKQLPKGMQKCLTKMQHSCSLNEKLAVKDPAKAGEEYRRCIERSLEKIKGEDCKELKEASRLLKKEKAKQISR